MKSPIFLLCSERSGSNLVTRMFDAHPAVSSPTPTHLFRIIGKNAMRYGGAPAARRDQLLQDIEALFAAKLGAWRIDKSDWRALLRGSKADRPQSMIATLYQAEAAASGKSQVLIKENQVHEYAPFLLSEFPDARFLHVVRDPRDMALSWLNAASIRGGPVRAAETWLRDQRGALELAAALHGRNRVAFLRYEDLIADPIDAIEPAASELGLDFQPAMLEYFNRGTVEENASRVHEWRNTNAPILRDNSGKFAAGLAEEQIAFVEHHCATLMPVFGYAAGLPAVKDPAGLRARLASVEPLEKAAYAALPDAERTARERWTRIVAEISGRAIPPAAGPAASDRAATSG